MIVIIDPPLGVTVNTVAIGRSRGRAGRTPPPTGPNSFIFAHIFAEKHPRQRSTPPPQIGPRHPYGKSWIRYW